MKLIIVESPAKGNTIQKFLGKEYKVLSSYGHVRDLPKSKLGVDVENNFEPHYIIPLKAKKTVRSLKEESKKADITILATDEDREGEAIAWHLSEILELKEEEYQRIAFHEITKQAIEEALKNPRKIDINLVEAQQARRILDRIVGYKLSPFLWKKIVKGLSAGRVQSIAVKFVVDREREIQAFIPQEYWSIEAILKKTEGDPSSFNAMLHKINGKAILKPGIKSKEKVKKITKELEEADYSIENVEKKETKRNPFPPLTTSTMQQEAWKKLHSPAKFTMMSAQRLYEAGLISYHRTDSLNLSEQSLVEAKKWIIESYGNEYWPGFSRRFKTKSKKAQEAHEAIRPTVPGNSPEKIRISDPRQAKLYDLIWKRFTASQMSSAVFNSTTAQIQAQSKKENYMLKTSGQILKFEGFLKIYPMKFEELSLPLLEKDEKLKLLRLDPQQHFTQPPSRYTEASLIKVLEENDIGRPSTYAPTLSTIQTRNYIEKNEDKRFIPTEMGTTVNDLLVNHFPRIEDIKFTAKMEKNLDDIAQGEKQRVNVLREFYEPFEENLKQKYEEVSKKEEFTDKPSEKTCPKCNAPLIIKFGRFGKFLACSKFPECKYTESLEKKELGIKCPKCKIGDIVEKRTKSKKIFYGCSSWPDCDFALWDKPINETCPECKSLLITTKKGEIKCSNKECGYKK